MERMIATPVPGRNHGQIRSVGEVSAVVGEYEGPEVGEYVRDLRRRFDNEEEA